jgi:hypothetical protein
MADEDVATRAPESDAVKDSPFPGDSIAQEGPSMGVSTRLCEQPGRVVLTAARSTV